MLNVNKLTGPADVPALIQSEKMIIIIS